MKRLFVLATTLFFLTGFVTMAAAQQTQAPKSEHKQTTLGKYVNALEAYRMYRANPGKTYILDVRTPEEYDFVGHADFAANVPLLLWGGHFNAEKKSYSLAANPDFDAAVKARYKPDDTILVMCRSGQRSAAAVNAMAKAGFKNVYNIVDGFEGDKVAEQDSYYKGKRLKDGWRNAGLPWTYDLDPQLVYAPAAK